MRCSGERATTWSNGDGPDLRAALLTARSLEECQRALWFKLWVTLPLVLVFYLTGTVLFAYYQVYPDGSRCLNADNQIIAREECPTDQQTEAAHRRTGSIAALLRGSAAAHAFAGPADRRGLRGDHGRRLGRHQRAGHRCSHGLPADRRRSQAELSSAGAGADRQFGILATLLALVIGKLGTLVEATLKIMGLFGGPLLGIFFLGVLSRRANGGSHWWAWGCRSVGMLVAFSRKFLPWASVLSVDRVCPAGARS